MILQENIIQVEELISACKYNNINKGKIGRRGCQISSGWNLELMAQNPFKIKC